ncbi:MAG: hypothetical protein AAF564_14555, partial [Bacteroidota bacterium]
MKRLILLLLLLIVPLSSVLEVHAQQRESFDYWQHNKTMVWRGVQALMMCNGIFVSDRTVDQVFEQELAYIRGRYGPVVKEDYAVDVVHQAVGVGLTDNGPAMRAANRPGLGCVMMAPDQTFEDVADLPALQLPPLPGDPATVSWPDGDLVTAA